MWLAYSYLCTTRGYVFAPVLPISASLRLWPVLKDSAQFRDVGWRCALLCDALGFGGMRNEEPRLLPEVANRRADRYGISLRPPAAFTVHSFFELAAFDCMEVAATASEMPKPQIGYKTLHECFSTEWTSGCTSLLFGASSVIMTDSIRSISNFRLGSTGVGGDIRFRSSNVAPRLGGRRGRIMKEVRRKVRRFGKVGGRRQVAIDPIGYPMGCRCCARLAWHVFSPFIVDTSSRGSLRNSHPITIHGRKQFEMLRTGVTAQLDTINQQSRLKCRDAGSRLQPATGPSLPSFRKCSRRK